MADRDKKQRKPPAIQLDDLIPREDIRGGSKRPRDIFGVRRWIRGKGRQ